MAFLGESAPAVPGLVKGNNMKKLLVAVLGLLPLSVFAVGPDFTALTAGVDFGTLVAAVMAVAVLSVGFVVAKGGAAGIVRFIARMAGH